MYLISGAIYFIQFALLIVLISASVNSLNCYENKTAGIFSSTEKRRGISIPTGSSLLLLRVKSWVKVFRG
jgi:hypothetical protein